MQGEILQVNLPWWFPKDENLVPLPLAIGVEWRRCVCVYVCLQMGKGERLKDGPEACMYIQRCVSLVSF